MMFFRTSRTHFQQAMPSNLYKVLGIGKGATPSQVKKAFVALAKQYHPDSKNGHPEMFQQVSEAYKVLSDPLKRAEYDLELNRQNMSESLHKFQQDDTGLDMYADEQKIRTINMTEEEKEKLIQEMARRKKEFRKTHENMFREMRKQKRSPFKLILLILGGVLFLWSVKLTMWYNSVYKNWKGTDVSGCLNNLTS